MDLAEFAAASRVRFLIGKGGVGKTAVTCALAKALADAGQRVLLVELEGRPEVPMAFGADTELDYVELPLFESPTGGSVIARRLTPDEALLEYLSDHGMARLSRRLLSSGVLDVVAGAIPGIREVLLLGKIKQIANEAPVDVVLVDAPATSHAVTLLTSPAGVATAARSGPVRHQADEVVAMLSDPTRASVILVTIPEELPVTETIEAAFKVEDLAGVALGPVVANRVDVVSAALTTSAHDAAAAAHREFTPEVERALDDAATFARHRARVGFDELARLRSELPLPVIELPRLLAPAIGPEQLTVLAGALTAGLAPITEAL